MSRKIVTREGDVVDQLALAVYGRTAGATEAILHANPGLAAIGPVLPQGVTVILPELAAAERVTTVVRLWD